MILRCVLNGAGTGRHLIEDPEFSQLSSWHKQLQAKVLSLKDSVYSDPSLQHLRGAPNVLFVAVDQNVIEREMLEPFWREWCANKNEGTLPFENHHQFFEKIREPSTQTEDSFERLFLEEMKQKFLMHCTVHITDRMVANLDFEPIPSGTSGSHDSAVDETTRTAVAQPVESTGMVLATEADLCAEAVSRCSTQVQQWLAGHSPLLEDYHQPLIEQGYGDLSLLRQLTQAEAAALADDLAMKSGHKKVFLQALLQQLPVDKLRGRLQVPELPMQVLALVARDLNGNQISTSSTSSSC